jgi:hypothetical protein
VGGDRPVLLCCPYLPLREPVEFSGWWLGPLNSYEGPWLSTALESRTRQFLGSFSTPGGGAVENPALLARVATGVDGEAPSVEEQHALERAIAYATIDANPWWEPDAQAWGVATADNADLWVQPLGVSDGSISLGRGGRVVNQIAGYSVEDKNFRIPAPLELHTPFGVRLDVVVVEAAFETLLRPLTEHTERARRIAVAMHWVVKSWLNSPSISETDRLVFLKTASEALTGATWSSVEAARALRMVFEGALTQEGEGIGADQLLWRPEEPTFTRTRTTRAGKPVHEEVSALEHWYMALADARNDVVHAVASPVLGYEQPDSAYEGPLVEVADRVLREAIGVELGAIGHPSAWRRGLKRAGFMVWRRLREQQD